MPFWNNLIGDEVRKNKEGGDSSSTSSAFEWVSYKEVVAIDGQPRGAPVGLAAPVSPGTVGDPIPGAVVRISSGPA